MAEPAIAAENLVVQFGEFRAVDNVSLRVEQGEVFGFLGPNGSGKTTFIKALCGLLPIASGEASILGIAVRKDAAAVRRRVGYMSQKFGLYEDLTVAENITFYAKVYGLSEERLRARREAVVELTLLGPYMERRAGQLSGGWKQRLALACAIVHEPEVVFLDEPTAGIDPVARRALWDLVFALAAGRTTFFVTTHYMDEAERCSRVGYIYLSQLLAYGEVKQLQESAAANPAGSYRAEITGGADFAVARALAELRQLPGVSEATIFGRAIHALVEEKMTPEAVRAAVAGVERVVPIAPSLEDVFVTLTHAAQRRMMQGISAEGIREKGISAKGATGKGGR